MLKKLENIASIFSGVSFRSKIEHNPMGRCGVIQMRNLINDYSRIDGGLDCVDLPASKKKFVLKRGDILLISKGVHNKAVEITDAAPLKVASSAFFVIRINKPEVHSGYLTWFLNSSRAQNYFKKNHTGSYTPSLKKSVLEELEVPLPIQTKQNSISELFKLHNREKIIQQNLIVLRDQYIDDLLDKTIK